MSKQDLIYDLVKDNSSKLERMDDKIDNLHITSTKNTDNLKEHMRRTEASETRLTHIEDKLTVTYLLKIISSSILTSGAIAAAIYQIIRVIN